MKKINEIKNLKNSDGTCEEIYSSKKAIFIRIGSKNTLKIIK